MPIQVKRIYDPPAETDGKRILIDRLWPRGLSKASAGVDLWLRDIAVSTELRKWYQHDPAKWTEFKRRYFREIDAQPAAVQELKNAVSEGTVTLLFASKELELNNAVALREYLNG